MAKTYTKYEVSRLIGARALQLSCGAPPLINVDETDNPLTIAKREFIENMTPLTVYRKA